MKKVLLTIAALATCAATIKAQTRMILYEEFTGENCPPCAAYNPGLWTLVTAGTNPSKIQVIKYMSPIPSAGQFYYQNQAQTDARTSYYSVPFAPYGRMDGKVPDPGANAGNIASFVQSDIDAESAISAAFNITISNVAYNSTFDGVTATVNITCVAPYTGTSVYMRAALVETVNWATPPGTNGETDFENVVRTMYPNPTGTSIASTWTVGQTQTLTISGAIPSYVDKSGSPYLVAWIQNDGDKTIAQASKSAALGGVALDVSSQSITSTSSTACTGGTSTNFTPSITIKNSGTSALTSAVVYYKVDNGAWASTPWTGSLNAGATSQFSLPSISVTGGTHTITDSVGMPNGVADENSGNNNSSMSVTVLLTAAQNLPISNTFEYNGALPANWYILGEEYGADDWGLFNDNGGAALGHNNSTWAAAIKTIESDPGSKAYMVMPTPVITNPTTLDFWVAAAEQSAASTDALDVVYSTDCGSTWTSIWNKTGMGLATTTAFHTSDIYLPAQGDWKEYTTSLNNLPAGSVLAFQATAGNGNVIILDDINVTNNPASVNSVVANNSISIYPNPAKDNAVLSMSLTAAAKIQVQVIDEVGRTAMSMNEMQLTAGTQNINISTATLAPGLYTVKIMSDNSVISTQRLSVVK